VIARRLGAMGQLFDLEVERLVRRADHSCADEGAAALERVRDLYYEGRPAAMIQDAVKKFLLTLSLPS